MKNSKKYALYERAVQSPEAHVEFFKNTYRQFCDTSKSKRSETKANSTILMREDFCGTHALSCEWVKLSKKHSALGLDLSREPIEYGKKVHQAALTEAERKRVEVQLCNVLQPPTKKVDFIVACNFSFFIFKEREVLKQYFRSCKKTLKSGGMLLLELAGGPGMIETFEETKMIYTKTKPRKKEYIYVWDQQSFDPINNRAKYAIHFEFPTGRKMRNAFTYDWRLWSIPEVREVLLESGFKAVHVLWESTHAGKGTGEYLKMKEGDNSHAWVAYVVGIA